MRADRLVSLLLLLQNRGRMTALELSTELEVSVRTYRVSRVREAQSTGELFDRPTHRRPTGEWKCTWKWSRRQWPWGDLLRMGASAEVLGPPDLRRAVAVEAAALARLYGGVE